MTNLNNIGDVEQLQGIKGIVHTINTGSSSDASQAYVDGVESGARATKNGGQDTFNVDGLSDDAIKSYFFGVMEGLKK